MKFSSMPIAQACACPCGRARFMVRARPFARMYCHCLICQRLCRAPFADVSVLWAHDLSAAPPERVRTARHRHPPALDRSLCIDCGLPVHGVLAFGPLRAFAFVPSANLGTLDLPPPASHIFWHRRVGDIDDALPKHAGYLRSQLATTALLLRSALAARAP